MATGEGHRSVSRALHALELTVGAEDGLSLGELADRVGAAKSSMLPLLRALVARGYLVHELNRYRTGPALTTLAAVDRPALVPIARPHMVALRERFDETVMLGAMVGDTLVYLHTEESHQLVRYSPPRVRPPTDHPSSIGKLYLAQLDDTDLDQRLLSDAAPTKREELRREVVEARSTGTAFNHGDTFPDLSAVAVRIDGPHGILACLAIGGPSRRIDARTDELAVSLRAAATEIAAALG